MDEKDTQIRLLKKKRESIKDLLNDIDDLHLSSLYFSDEYKEACKKEEQRLKQTKEELNTNISQLEKEKKQLLEELKQTAYYDIHNWRLSVPEEELFRNFDYNSTELRRCTFTLVEGVTIKENTTLLYSVLLEHLQKLQKQAGVENFRGGQCTTPLLASSTTYTVISHPFYIDYTFSLDNRTLGKVLGSIVHCSYRWKSKTPLPRTYSQLY
jgi:hypothetical protein